MSLKLRLVLLSTIWLIFILILFNVFVYFFVIKITTKSEVQLLWNKADTISEQGLILQTENWEQRHLLDHYLVSNELIRIVDMKGRVVNQICSNDKLLEKPTALRNTFHSEVINNGGVRFIFVQVPLYRNEAQIGMLEIGRVLNILENYMNILLTALTVTSIGAVILSLIGGYFYSRFLFRPIHQLADTMETIQQSGEFKKLDMSQTSSTDELGKLGLTFNEMIGRLEYNFAQQKRFVEDASHELKTPLTIIESYANLLKRWASNDPELRNEAIDAIRSEAARLIGLITSLFVLVETDRNEMMKRETISLIPLISTTVNSIKQTFKREIHLEVESNYIQIYGDPEKIKQLLIILLDNAIKYSNKSILVKVEEDRQRVKLMIADQGEGIHGKELPHIFDRFYRVDKARNRKTGGAGLGLSIAKNIVELHHGYIEISSAAGKGTTVTLQFPKK